MCIRDRDEDAAFIRNTIIERVTGIHPKESTVLNPNLDPAILKKKKMVLDIRVKDSEGREYGIEMQTTYSKQSELKLSLIHICCFMAEAGVRKVLVHDGYSTRGHGYEAGE